MVIKCGFGVGELRWEECGWSICMDESWEELNEVRVEIEILLSILLKEFGLRLMDILRGDEGEVWVGLIWLMFWKECWFGWWLGWEFSGIGVKRGSSELLLEERSERKSGLSFDWPIKVDCWSEIGSGLCKHCLFVLMIVSVEFVVVVCEVLVIGFGNEFDWWFDLG